MYRTDSVQIHLLVRVFHTAACPLACAEKMQLYSYVAFLPLRLTGLKT
jgi:hypothetical protein